MWSVGVCGALVESAPFVRRVMGSTPALAATDGPSANSSFTVAGGASAWNSGPSVLCRERLSINQVHTQTERGKGGKTASERERKRERVRNRQKERAPANVGNIRRSGIKSLEKRYNIEAQKTHNMQHDIVPTVFVDFERALAENWRRLWGGGRKFSNDLF